MTPPEHSRSPPRLGGSVAADGHLQHLPSLRTCRQGRLWTNFNPYPEPDVLSQYSVDVRADDLSNVLTLLLDRNEFADRYAQVCCPKLCTTVPVVVASFYEFDVCQSQNPQCVDLALEPDQFSGSWQGALYLSTRAEIVHRTDPPEMCVLCVTAGYRTKPVHRQPQQEGESASTDRRAGVVRQIARTSGPPRRSWRRLRGRLRRPPLPLPTPVRLPQAASHCQAPGPVSIARQPSAPDERPVRHSGQTFWSNRVGCGRTRWLRD